MIRGMYEAAASMVSSMTRLTRLSNNLANISTPGYKQDITVPKSFQEQMLNRVGGASANDNEIGSLSTVVVADHPVIDLKQGALRETGRPMDVALSGSGFLVIQTERGIQYSRNGSLQVDPQGLLTTSNNERVLGEDNGPIILPGGKTPIITETGSVVVDGEVVGRLKLVDFPPDAQLRKVGHSNLEAVNGEPIPATEVGIFQGYLEGSNVDVANQMIELLSSRKTYSSSQRIMQMADSALQRAVSELGRV